jgi:hypothetical protein
VDGRRPTGETPKRRSTSANSSKVDAFRSSPDGDKGDQIDQGDQLSTTESRGLDRQT